MPKAREKVSSKQWRRYQQQAATASSAYIPAQCRHFRGQTLGGQPSGGAPFAAHLRVRHQRGPKRRRVPLEIGSNPLASLGPPTSSFGPIISLTWPALLAEARRTPSERPTGGHQAPIGPMVLRGALIQFALEGLPESGPSSGVCPPVWEQSQTSYSPVLSAAGRALPEGGARHQSLSLDTQAAHAERPAPS